MTDNDMDIPPGMEAAIRAAEWLGRVRFRHDDAAQWWRECMAACDAMAEAMAAEAGEPPALIGRAHALLRELADVLARPCGPGQDVLAAAASASPAATTLERLGREGLPLLADAAAALHRQVHALAETTPAGHGGPVLRRLLHVLADLYAEGFTTLKGEPAPPSHGTPRDGKGASPFARFLEAVLAEHAEQFERRHGCASPLQPEAATQKRIRDALAARPPATVWPG